MVTVGPGRRADAGAVRLGDRDITGLRLYGEHYGVPYDLLAAVLERAASPVAGIVAQWRTAGCAAGRTPMVPVK